MGREPIRLCGIVDCVSIEVDDHYVEFVCTCLFERTRKKLLDEEALRLVSERWSVGSSREKGQTEEGGPMTEYGELLEQALEEAVAIKEGRAEPARVSRVPLSAKTAEVEPPPDFSPTRIRKVRRSLLMSQAVFADMLNVSGSTVAAWEQGDRHPTGATLRLLELAEQNPGPLAARVRRRKTG